MAELPISGLDFAWGNPPYDTVKRAGYRFVMRYVSHDPGKDLDGPELKEWHKRGIGVGLVYESTAGRALQGESAGITDAEYADHRCKELGLPGLPVYFAVDFDATDAQKPKILNYINGAAKALGKDRVGVYGSFYVVRYLAGKKACKWFWQTYAWSGGNVHSATHVYQYHNGAKIGSLSCDLNKARSGPIGVAYLGKPVPKADPRVARWKKRLSDVRRVAKLVGWIPGLKRYAKKLEKAIKDNS
jgi:hypothetical protein